MEKIDSGELGDANDFFGWYAAKKALISGARNRKSSWQLRYEPKPFVINQYHPRHYLILLRKLYILSPINKNTV